MSLRSFFRKVEGFNKRRRYEQEQNKQLLYAGLACTTAELYNVIGAANSEKGKWKAVQPKAFLDGWLGNATTESGMDRWNRAMKLHESRLQREANRRD